MLARTKRLHGKKEFRDLFEKGRVLESTNLSLKYLRNTEGRCGVSVSTRVSKSAVVRNYIRRRLYALLSQYPNQLNENILIRVKKDVSDVNIEGLKKELWGLLAQVRSWQSKQSMPTGF